ncbi:PREDICTED: RING-H2 finger protein ATL3-like [Nelumbo nucifera]|uniref:RING-type E3 ubiquitin transferase n=2 Tax=Nelumbo nucifera TaxID=4432 RepID=A0A1U7YUX1_NELNU|nr:PREDICTED: RING-H2 finger protein ATL3-like [Nelumbo nucifera]DAD28628.1 TPA_asm: hypothetical protein HUJ06_030096 [Nelumbo nucifera]
MESMESSSSSSQQSSVVESRLILTPLMISLAGVLATALAIVAYNLVLTRYCLGRRHGRISQHTHQEQEHQVATGVEEKVLQSIPVLTYSSKQSGSFLPDQTECAICLVQLEEGDIVRWLPNCRHAFHLRCIDQWFASHANCPLCRSPIAAVSVAIALPMPSVGAEAEEDRVHDRVDAHSQAGTGGHQVGVNDSISQLAHSSNRLLRHCSSLILLAEINPPPLLPVALKRSWSMDFSHKTQQDTGGGGVSSSVSSSSLSPPLSSSSNGGVLKLQSSSRRAAMLTRSLSLLGIGRGCTTNRILPQ